MGGKCWFWVMMVGCVLGHLCTTAVTAENCLHVDTSFVIASKGKFQHILDELFTSHKEERLGRYHFDSTFKLPAQGYGKSVTMTDLETEHKSSGSLAVFTNH